MAHPRMYSDDDPVLARVRTLCLSFPGAGEHESHGRPTFRTKKIFAVFGGMEKGGAEAPQYPRSLLLKVDPDEMQRLLGEAGFFLPAYYGPYGWIGVELDRPLVDWDEVRELVEDSYRLTAPRSLVSKLES